jgi:hypothetical protein
MFGCCFRQINKKDNDIELLRKDLFEFTSRTIQENIELKDDLTLLTNTQYQLNIELNELKEKYQKTKKDVSRIVTIYNPKEFIVFKIVLLSKAQINTLLKSVYNDLDKEYKISLCDPKICSFENIKTPEEARNGGGPLKNPLSSTPPPNIRTLSKLGTGIDDQLLGQTELSIATSIWYRMQYLALMYCLFKDFAEKVPLYRSQNYYGHNGNLGIVYKWEHTKILGGNKPEELIEKFFDIILKNILN